MKGHQKIYYLCDCYEIKEHIKIMYKTSKDDYELSKGHQESNFYFRTYIFWKLLYKKFIEKEPLLLEMKQS